MKILNIIEFILFGLLTVAFISNNINHDAIPFVFEFSSISILVYIFITAYEVRKNRKHILPSSISIGLTILAIIAVQTSYHSNTQTNIPLLYILVINGISLMGKKWMWLFSCVVIIITEITYRLYSVYLPDSTELSAVSLDIAKNAILPIIILLFTGLLSSIVINQKNKTKNATSSGQSILPEKPVVPPVQTDYIAKQEETFSPTKTQMFSTDYISEFKHKHDEGIQEILYSVVYFMSRNFKAYSALGFIYDPDSRTFVLNSYQSKSMNIAKGVAIALGDGIVGKIGSEKHSFLSGDFSFYNSPLQYYSSAEEINSIMAVPIISDNKELLGTLVLDSLDKKAFTDQDKELLKRFSLLAAALITNASMKLYQEKSARTFQTFFRASHDFTTALKFGDVCNVLFDVVQQVVINCTQQIIVTFDKTENCGVVYKVAGKPTGLNEGFKFPINAGLYSFVFQKRRMITIEDFLQCQSKYYLFYPNEPKRTNIRSLIILPFFDDEGRCRGLFSVESDKPNLFNKNTVQILSTFIDSANIAFTRALLYEKMEQLATTDGLTGLNNHRNFQEILAQEIERGKRYNRQVSLLLMDIDHFKNFNDTYGHPVGDLVLKEVATCIRSAIRLNDTPARYGGEEFTVIIPETNEHGAMVIAERIRTCIEEHVINSLGRLLHVTVSIGCASWPTMVSTQQDLIDCADQALYFSKEHGRNKVTLFNHSMSGKK